MSVRASFSETLGKATTAVPTPAASEQVRTEQRALQISGMSATVLAALMTLVPNSELTALLEPAPDVVPEPAPTETSSSMPETLVVEARLEQAVQTGAETTQTAAAETSETTEQPSTPVPLALEHALLTFQEWLAAQAEPVATTPVQGESHAATTPTGSSTSPAVLESTLTASSAETQVSALAAAAVAATASPTLGTTTTAGADFLRAAAQGATFKFTGPAGWDNFDVYIGQGGGTTVDFSGLIVTPLPQVKTGTDGPLIAFPGPAPQQFTGVFVDLTATSVIRNTTAAGSQTVQAWSLDTSGHVAAQVAHLAGIDNVVATVGGDILLGSTTANVFVYTPVATPGTTTGADGASSSTAPVYALDIYSGGKDAPLKGAGIAAPTDLKDRADFSHVDDDKPSDVAGITVDLAASTTLSVADPTGSGQLSVKGSLVSSHGQSNATHQLALLAWTSGTNGHSSIEEIVGSRGADALWGDAADNTFVFISSAADASFIDGRDGKDAVDFSRFSGKGISVDLSDLVDDFDDPVGGTQHGVALAKDDTGTTLAGLKNIEKIVGTTRSDKLVGNASDNIFTGGDGVDTFVFKLRSGATGIGHDVVTDFKIGVDTVHDRIIFSPDLLAIDSSASIQAKMNELFDHATDTAQGLMFTFDTHSSLLLNDIHLADFENADHSLKLVAYDYFFFS